MESYCSVAVLHMSANYHVTALHFVLIILAPRLSRNCVRVGGLDVGVMSEPQDQGAYSFSCFSAQLEP